MNGYAPRWFYILNGRRRGPVDFYGLADLIIKQEIPEDSLVWHSGLSSWVKACDLDDIRVELPPSVPLPPHESGSTVPADEFVDTGPSFPVEIPPPYPRLETDNMRRHRQPRHKPATDGRWLALLFAVLLVVIMGLWWVLRRVNDVPGGQVIQREGRLRHPSRPASTGSAEAGSDDRKDGRNRTPGTLPLPSSPPRGLASPTGSTG